MSENIETTPKLRIAIAASGRFHVLDLARELNALGHEVKFYSYVPKRRAMRFGLPKKCHVGILPFVFPWLFLDLLFGNRWKELTSKWTRLALDRFVTWRLQPCDVFIGMSSTFEHAPLKAKKEFGAKVLIERGSRHILSQKAILSAINGAATPSDFDVSQELKSYEIADMVVIPSRHVQQSFLDYGFPQEKLFVNPYGVDVCMFKPRRKKPGSGNTGIMTGTWCVRKGADLLFKSVPMVNGLSLLHVGPLGDCPFPSQACFVHVDKVDQTELPEYYALADFFILPSREEGLSLVIAQALASGLPVVCTPRTGGADLKNLIDYPAAVIEVPNESPSALAEGIRKSLEESGKSRGIDYLGEKGRNNLTWKAYGKRYEQRLLDLMR